MMKSRET